MRPGSQLMSALTGVIILTLTVIGCGGTSPGTAARSSTAQTPSTTAATAAQTTPTARTASTPTEREPKLDIALKSSVPLEPIPSRYTCDGTDLPIPLNWSNVPKNTVELDLFIFRVIPTAQGKLVPQWGVAGLPPSLRKLSARQLPRGAILGRNSSGRTGYSLCPRKGKTVAYAALVYALSHRVSVKPGFDTAALLEHTVSHTAESEGRIFFSYRRH